MLYEVRGKFFIMSVCDSEFVSDCDPGLLTIKGILGTKKDLLCTGHKKICSNLLTTLLIHKRANAGLIDELKTGKEIVIVGNVNIDGNSTQPIYVKKAFTVDRKH